MCCSHVVVVVSWSVENPDHSDFLLLRNMLVRTHMQDLKDVTRETHYENYRAQCIQNMTRMVVQERKRSLREKRRDGVEADFPLPLAIVDAEKERLIFEKDEELRRMQEVLERIQEQMQNSQRGGFWFSHNSLGEEREREEHSSASDVKTTGTCMKRKWAMYTACCSPGQHTASEAGTVVLRGYVKSTSLRIHTEEGQSYSVYHWDTTSIIQAKAILLFLIWFFKSSWRIDLFILHEVIFCSHSHEWLSAVLYSNCVGKLHVHDYINTQHSEDTLVSRN